MTIARLGMLTPSSNTALEPQTYGILTGLPSVTAHFSRLRVTRMAAEAESDSQFDAAAMRPAAMLLADAGVGVIAWNGTSGSWLGPDRDRQLCRDLTEATGIAATTSTLALLDGCRRLQVTRLGLATPYVEQLNHGIASHYANEGIRVVTSEHLGITDNLTVGALTTDEICGLVRRAARNDAQAVAVVCTNVAATEHVRELERELGVPVLDSIAVTAWKCLEIAGVRERPAGYGALMDSGDTAVAG